MISYTYIIHRHLLARCVINLDISGRIFFYLATCDSLVIRKRIDEFLTSRRYLHNLQRWFNFSCQGRFQRRTVHAVFSRDDSVRFRAGETRIQTFSSRQRPDRGIFVSFADRTIVGRKNAFSRCLRFFRRRWNRHLHHPMHDLLDRGTYVVIIFRSDEIHLRDERRIGRIVVPR